MGTIKLEGVYVECDSKIEISAAVIYSIYIGAAEGEAVRDFKVGENLTRGGL